MRRNIYISLVIAAEIIYLGVYGVWNVFDKEKNTENNYTYPIERYYTNNQSNSSLFSSHTPTKTKYHRQTTSTYAYDDYNHTFYNPIDDNTSPFTFLSSKATTHHIGNNIEYLNNSHNDSYLQSNFKLSSNTTKGIKNIAAPVWIGNVSPVATPTLAYVDAPSGNLPGEMFAPRMRKAPPDEEDDGTNGPNIGNQPLGDGIIFLSLIAILYGIIIYRKRQLQ